MEPAAKGRRKNEAKDRIMSESMKAGNQVRLIVLTVLTGAFAGAVVWCFLKAVSLGSALIWEVIPQGAGTRFILPALCAAGGLITGVVHHFSGNYPDELSVVLYKVKKEKHYDYHHFPAILASAFLRRDLRESSPLFAIGSATMSPSRRIIQRCTLPSEKP